LTSDNHQESRSDRPPPLAIASANLDHIHHFGSRGAHRHDLDAAGSVPAWLVLIDGTPLVRRARTLTGAPWPLLAGSDLLPPLLETAQRRHATVGFLGGTGNMHQLLRDALARRYPALRIGGLWSPKRDDLTDPAMNARLLTAIRKARIDLLVVCLGKPRQERWIQQHAEASGARVLLAFGAAADFLAGTATRAPAWVRQHDLEWLYRLVKEPRRLAGRYCLQAPVALWRLWTRSRTRDPQ
jgi:exopolysaccharide biosynthesis WecB/TagA/CpsF family protein